MASFDAEPVLVLLSQFSRVHSQLDIGAFSKVDSTFRSTFNSISVLLPGRILSPKRN